MATVKTTSINSLMTKAQLALSRNHWFEAERLCARALDMARGECDFNLMARIVLPLQEARRQRMQIAFDSKLVNQVSLPHSTSKMQQPQRWIPTSRSTHLMQESPICAKGSHRN